MKNVIKLLRIIVLTAVIGFTMVTCGNGAGTGTAVIQARSRLIHVERYPVGTA
jgi:hypothetical protein